MDYFPHDTRAMGDDKLLALRLIDGLEAVAVYWAVLEKIYADEKPFILSETNVGCMSVSYMCGIGFEELTKMVFHMVDLGLFERDENDGNAIYSERATRQIEAIEKKRETARQNGKNGGRKPVRKPTKTNVGSKSVASENQDSRNLNIKGIGSYKKNQIPDSGSVGADAAEAAPPSPPKCPLCGTELERTGIQSEPWWCSNCKDGFSDEKVVA